jgi:hypothetical protein
MRVHVRVRRWVVWWVYIGIACGVIAFANMEGHDLTRWQDRVLILMGLAHWLLGGIVCWAFHGVRFEPQKRPPETIEAKEKTFYLASDFVPRRD